MPFKKLILLSALGLALNAHAQSTAAPASAPASALRPALTAGTLVVVPAFGEVRHANDEATVTFAVEEQDKDRAAATARVNQKMKQGTDIVKSGDPQAQLKTVGYYTYPVYPEVPDGPRPLANQAARRVPIGWRVGQYLEVTTRNLQNLPKVAAAAQKVLNLNGVDYHLSKELQKRLDDERIAATYANLNERIASIAKAMGRGVNDAVIDTVDFEGSGNYAGEAAPQAAPAMMMRAARADAGAMPEPSFEPGETTLSMRLVGKVRFR
ncbi:SIMPL domain-containing protein [Massilia sp. YIM B02763]|uniref:SIMPL domain-containing protein n=1 Tax=Massilia sp. YIM B02763 TaxID=3050130 RepID=UPI0025B73473|nr:SIMPL domain-containing protein [Massilia sp. YIM B02763]MDN4054420.1 SIMPL domain-containing protein [Massilia sp. YIM B02763]